MIIGTFQSATGVISIEIDNGGSVIDMPITGIGELSYNFDVTPEAVTIDRMLALYSGIRVDFGEFNEIGVNIYDTLNNALLNAPDKELPATLKIKTHELIEYEFPFTVDIGDVSFDEGAHSGSFTCKALAKDVTFEEVFNEIDNSEKRNYQIRAEAPLVRRDDGNFVTVPGVLLSGLKNIPATGVRSWIEAALKKVFDNEYSNDIRISTTGLDEEGYSKFIYDSLQRVDQEQGSATMLTLLNIGSDFTTIDDDFNRLERTGTVTILANETNPDDPAQPDGVPVLQVGDVRMEAGEGVNFEGAGVLSVRDRVHVKINDVWVFAGTVKDIVDPTLAIINITNGGVIAQDLPWSVFRGNFANQRPALDVLKELAGTEGAIFGTGFSKNFYFNRIINALPDIELDYNLVNRMRPASSNLFLGNSRVTQLSTTQSVPAQLVKRKQTFWQRVFGRNRFDFEIGEIPDDPYGVFPTSDSDNQINFARFGLPIMSRHSSIVAGNPRASKELLIEIPTAYPLMSRGRYNGTTIIGRYSNHRFDSALESRLTAVGLRSYFRALTNEENDLKIEFELQGALTLKPWELFAFKNVPETPERYRGKTFRISQIRYNLVDDVCRVVAYQITDFDIDPVSSSPDVPTLSLSRDSLSFEWNTKQPVTASVDIVAKGSSNPVDVSVDAIGDGFDISTDGVNFARSVRLNPDGFGSLAARVVVRFGASENPQLRFPALRRGFLSIAQGAISRRVRLSATVSESQSFNTVGVSTEAVGDATVSSVPVNMFTEVEKGNELILVGANAGARYAVTLSADIDTGEGNLSIEPQFMERDTYRVEVSQAATRTGITVSEREIVLKAVGDGRVAAVRLSAPAGEGTVINIEADTVNIVNVEFIREDANIGTGVIRSSNYEEGVSGWRITGNGDAEYNNVIVRGNIAAGNIVGNVDITEGSVYTEEDDGTFIRGIRMIGGQLQTSLDGTVVGFVRTFGALFRSGTALSSAQAEVSTTEIYVNANPQNEVNRCGVSTAVGVDTIQRAGTLLPAHRNGRIIYNSTTNKLQASVDGSWVDLH